MSDENGGGPYIRDMSPGQEISGVFGVADRRLRAFRDRSKGRFLQLRLCDVTGSIPAMLWDEAESAAGAISVGDVLWVRAKVEEFRGRPQLVLQSLKRPSSQDVCPKRFIPAAPQPLRDMEEELWQRIEMVGDPHLSQLLLILFQDEDTYTSYTTAPAGKTIHHNYLHGLLEHSLEVVSLLLREGGPGDMNRDLLITGGLLHDLGKTDEFFYRAAIGYTDEGRLLGHIVIGHRMVCEALRRVPDVPGRLALHLQHLVLSHHGKLEYGSPVMPQTPEAVALHHADMYSGKVAQMHLVADAAAEDGQEWSEFDPMLGRCVWVAGSRPEEGS